MWTKEHGAWAVLLAPILVGFAAARTAPAGVVALFACAALGGFCLRAPLQSLLSERPVPHAGTWTAAFALLAAAGALPLLALRGRWGLLAFSVPATLAFSLNLHLQRTRRSLSFVNEAAGVAALCLGAPAACYAALGSLPARAWTVWALCVLHFLGPIFHVKLAALQHRAASEKTENPALAPSRHRSVLYHAAALLLVSAAAAFHFVPLPALAPFLISLLKAVRRAAAPAGKVDFRRLGYQEVVYACLFAACAGAGFALR